MEDITIPESHCVRVREVTFSVPVDGGEIEAFIQENYLRAGGVNIYPSEHEKEFSHGKTYRAIIVESPSTFGKDSAEKLARQFNGERFG